MITAKRAVVAARSAASITVGLTRATRRPDRSANYAAHFLFHRAKPVALSWHGFQIWARGLDWPALQEVLIENEYGALADYLVAQPSPVVLDLGANIGTFSLFVFSIAPTARVHSFEPSAATFDVLSKTRRANPQCQWDINRAAAWREDGSISFANGLSSTAGQVAADGDETVPARSLASILRTCGGEIDVAKIDIEGAEEAVLADSQAELLRIRTLVVELHPDRCNSPRVVRALRECYGNLYMIPGRRSAKPLILATRQRPPANLPFYLD
ncbi:MAG: FkbM family methyltransferase [Hyphomicrobium aestuarii]|nr:FkbM family methyltransferase [Hyphomicrobium aestuarii]